MDRFIEKQLTEGALDSDGVFTLNPRLSYLRQDGAVLPEPQQWVLKLFQAINSMQTEKVCLTSTIMQRGQSGAFAG